MRRDSREENEFYVKEMKKKNTKKFNVDVN